MSKPNTKKETLNPNSADQDLNYEGNNIENEYTDGKKEKKYTEGQIKLDIDKFEPHKDEHDSLNSLSTGYESFYRNKANDRIFENGT